MMKLVSLLTLGLLMARPANVSPAVLSAPAMYADALAKEQAVRRALVDATDAAVMLKAVRTAVGAYESLVRQYPTSGYCDDALWNAAQLSIDAGRKFSLPAQTLVAVRLLKRLAAEYPSSKYARQAPELVAALDRSSRGTRDAAAGGVRHAMASDRTEPDAPPPVVAASPAAPASVVPAAAPAVPRPARSSSATLTGITRAVLPDVVRVTLALDAEVLFHQEELAGPPRVFFDFPGVDVAPELADRTIRFDNEPDIVRQIRVGKPSRGVVRVVLDMTGASACSAVPLYSPYRLVVDCVRDKDKTSAPDASTSRPVPQTPANFARKPLAADARPVAALGAPGASPPAAPIRTRPTADAVEPPLAARSIASHMAEPAVLSARSAVPVLAAMLPTGRPRVAASELAALAEEALTLPAVTNVPPAAIKQPVRAPATPARNLDGGFSMARQLGLRVSRIVIDPGHGGHDPGARGSGVSEASVVLDIAFRLEKLLLEEPGVEVVLTRRSDEFVPLEERTAIANREGADLFLSIHANASSVAQAAGIETYFLEFASNARDASVAARENAASGQPMSALPDFVKAIALNNKVDESRDFATHVQRALVQKLRGSNRSVRDLGVKQAPFVVLIGASMPSVLAEVSFVTNQREARLLQGQSYRQRIAEALFTAVQKYQASLTRVANVAQQ
jgi:N-acetylmuramoyl-L-alanine amidase